MAILPIRLIGDPVLRTPAAEVTDFGPELGKLIENMMETMDAVSGAGLAAPQIGVGLRVFTYRVTGQYGHVVNPVLENGEQWQEQGAEGCLSVPGLSFAAPRYQHSVVTGADRDGKPVRIEATGLLARCMQHETDHLEGRLFLERLSGEDRRAAMQAIRHTDFSGQAQRTAQHRGSQAQQAGSAFGVGR